MFLLDTNTCILFLKARSKQVERRLLGTKPSLINLCSVVKAELLYGAARSDDPAKARALLQVFFSPYESLPFDDKAAIEYGRIRGHLATAGTPIGPNDLLVAAIAVSQGLTLVTSNVAEFSRVPALAIEDWQH